MHAQTHTYIYTHTHAHTPGLLLLLFDHQERVLANLGQVIAVVPPLVLVLCHEIGTHRLRSHNLLTVWGLSIQRFPAKIPQYCMLPQPNIEESMHGKRR
jgi:hypothetical protein